MRNINIAILDSGIKKDHREFEKKEINARALSIVGNKVIEDDDAEDEVGHGTAVHYLIDKLTDKKVIYDFKIFSTERDVSQDDLVLFLKYISEYHVRFDVINISSGIVQCDDVGELQKICNMLYENGTIIVSAFDNDGAISFPAALNHVVGVDSMRNIKSVNDFIYIENSLVNVIGKNQIQKVAWTIPEYNMISGNSFTCCYVTAKVVRMLQSETFNLREISERRIINHQPATIQHVYEIKRAAVFPFNKEIHSLARYEDDLSFKIEGYYSVKESGQVGRKVSTILNNCSNETKIKDINLINWDDIDTLILGHLEELSRLVKKDYTKILLDKAIERGVKIFSFDIVDKYIPHKDQDKLGIYSPQIDAGVIQNNYGKLFQTNTPIVSVVGTSSNQGKFTLQLYIRKKLKEIGYKVGQIGTEPTSELFGIDYCIPMGYNSSVTLQPYEYLQVVNKMIWELSAKSEIILTGSQSSIATYTTDNIRNFPLNHQLFLEAVQPDAVILCINPYDELGYIEKSINLVKGLTSAEVIAAVCFPLDIDESWAGKMGRKVMIHDEKRNIIKDLLLSKLDLKLYYLDKPDELDLLIQELLYFFAGQEEERECVQ